MGTGPRLGVLGKLIKNPNSPDTPQIYGFREPLGPGNLCTDKLPKHVWKPRSAAGQLFLFSLSFFLLPAHSPDSFSEDPLPQRAPLKNI